MTFGERFKILRILTGYTQKTLADAADVSRASVMLWEKGNIPTRRTAMILASLFEVSLDYLLEGSHPPDYAWWKPIAPGHPTHLHTLSIDLAYGLPIIFRELEIIFAAKGSDGGESLWLCGNNPDNSIGWKLNYLLTCDKSLDSIFSNAIRAAVPEHIVFEVTSSHPIRGEGEYLNAVAAELKELTGEYPDIDRLYDRLGGLEGEGSDDFTLEGLLERFGEDIKNTNFMEIYHIKAIANYLAREVAERTGFSDIKSSATKLLRAAKKHANDID